MITNMKKRLAVYLAVLMMLPAVVAALPMALTEVSAASNSSLYWNLPYNIKEMKVEKGQDFYVGDYVNAYTYGAKAWSGTASQIKAKYSSSKKAVATVNSKGYFQAKKTGTTTITVSYGGKKLSMKFTVVPAKSLEASGSVSNISNKAAAIAKKIPSKITAKNGFQMLKLVTDFEAAINGQSAISNRGILRSNYSEGDKLIVPKAGRYLALKAMLTAFGTKNNPTSTRSAKVMKIKSVSATPKAITVKLQKKLDATQILAARILNSYQNTQTSGASKAYIHVNVYDTTKSHLYSGQAELKKGSSTLKITLQQYSYSDSKPKALTLQKGHTYQLESKPYWTKGKTVKVK